MATASNTVKAPVMGAPPYQLTLEDRLRWAQIADVMAQANHYAVSNNAFLSYNNQTKLTIIHYAVRNCIFLSIKYFMLVHDKSFVEKK